jgi:hypothetical protein
VHYGFLLETKCDWGKKFTYNIGSLTRNWNFCVLNLMANIHGSPNPVNMEALPKNNPQHFHLDSQLSINPWFLKLWIATYSVCGQQFLKNYFNCGCVQAQF